VKLFSNNSLPIIGVGELRRASKTDVRRAFDDYHEELEWLAEFLTGDTKLAEACIVDASAIATTQSEVFEHWLEHWARRATIRSAVEMQHSRIAQLAAAYERSPCSHRDHPWLRPEQLDMIHARSDELRSRLDVLGRAILVMRGIEKYSSRECELLLGISRGAMQAAYCAALESLDMLSCEITAYLEPSAVPCCWG
jgi:DNA-directed RNA polymerase specialized sigma24 family protein